MLRLLWKNVKDFFNSGVPALRRDVKPRNRSRHVLSPQFEGLEQRQLLAANPISFDSSTATIVIKGTSKNDTALVTLAGDGTVHVQLQTPDGSYNSVFAPATASAVKFTGGKGDDSFQNASNLPSEAFGDAGNDTLVGGWNPDRLVGGAGDDGLNGGDGHDVIDGGKGNDWLSGWTGNDTMIGGAGNDYFVGGIGDDVLQGDAGVDELYGQDGSDHLLGGDGNDVLGGAVGNDTLRGGEGDDHLSGEEGDDVILGDAGNDWLSGWIGNDVLWGGDGNDFLVGSLGDDVLNGDAGVDELYGQEGDDQLSGGAGNDILGGSVGNDKLYGGAGDDRLSGEEGVDELHGSDGNDWLSGWTGNDVLYGGSGNDELAGDDGDDSLYGQAGDDQLFSNAGNDWLWGGEGNDSLHGENGNNYLIGGAGNDVLIGSIGNDLLDGGADADSLHGSEGDDVLIGGLGADDLRGENGVDLLLGGTTIYEGEWESYMAMLVEWTAPNPYITRIELLESDSFAARLQSGETVHDDGVPDMVAGGGWQDWFVLTGWMPIYVPEGVHDHPHQHHTSGQFVTELPALEGFDLIDSLDKLSDRQSNEAIQSLVPHAENLTLQREHLSLFELVRYDEVTHFAVRSGDWSNPSTWVKNKVPGNGARVLIPMGVEVNVDGLFTAKIETIRVDGTLNFDAARDTELRADTVVVSGAGTFQMGTADEPIAPHVRARLLFTNTGAIDRKWDPFGISRGLISHGNVSVHGAEVSSIAALAGPVPAGSQTLVLASAPVGWKVGDSIAIASTSGAEQNEVRQILTINGTTLLVDQPLSFAHAAPAANLQVHVAHLTRNAVFESESPITARRGHVMFMHDRDVEIEYAGFYKLGRTDKLQVVNDSVVNSDWKLQSGTGTNQRARYPVHFHRNGLTKDGNPSVVKGSAVVDSPGWGFVNHSSYVDMIENVAYGVRGAAFATEVGDEIGGFYKNMALGTTGSGEADNSRETPFQDFGHQGDGFWFQGAGVSVVGNISAGNHGHAFAYYTRGLIEASGRGRFLSANLDDPSIANGAPTIDVGLVPVTNFRDNIGYSSFVGLLIRYHLQESPHNQRSRFEDSTFWNNRVGVGLHYTQNLILRNLEVMRTPDGLHTYGIESDIQEANVLYDNLTVIGYHTGIEMPRWGQNEVRGGTFNNTDHDILIPTAAWRDRSVLITGLTGTPRVTLLDDVRQIPDNNNFLFFEGDQVILNFGPLQSQRVYYWRQLANIVPFPEARPDIPPQYVGLTNQQLWNQFGKALSGAIAPEPYYTLPYIEGAVIPLNN